jgi:hypothetical protein
MQPSAQQFFVAPAQFFGVGVGFGAGLAVVGHGFGGQVVQGGVGHQAGVEAVLLAALVEHGQVVVGAVLVGAADAAEAHPLGRPWALKKTGLSCGCASGTKATTTAQLCRSPVRC